MPYKDPEKRKAYVQAYYEAHKEAIAAYKRVYQAEHREAHNASSHLYETRHREERTARRAEHRGKKNIYMRAYNAEHREARSAYYKAHPEYREARSAYCKAHPEQMAAKSRRRYALIRGATIGPIDLEAIKKRDRMLCCICGKRIYRKPKDPMMRLSFDHSHPISLGGPHTQENQRVAHLRCNLKRGAGRLPVQMVLV